MWAYSPPAIDSIGYVRCLLARRPRAPLAPDRRVLDGLAVRQAHAL